MQFGTILICFDQFVWWSQIAYEFKIIITNCLSSCNDILTLFACSRPIYFKYALIWIVKRTSFKTLTTCFVLTNILNMFCPVRGIITNCLSSCSDWSSQTVLSSFGTQKCFWSSHRVPTFLCLSVCVCLLHKLCFTKNK